MSFRDSTVVVIETDRSKIRAALGIHELLKTPSVVCLPYFYIGPLEFINESRKFSRA